MELRSSQGPSEQARQALAAYPAATSGLQRWLIWLDNQSSAVVDESSLLVQLRVGLPTLVDELNQYRLAGELQCRPVSGWGYDAYHYVGDVQVACTRMGGGAVAETERVVWTQPLTIAYNSRLPVVVYTPKDLKVSHRVLRANSDFLPASVG